MYYGWIIVLVTVLYYTIIIGATYSSFSVFVLPVSADMGLSRAEINTTVILLSAGSAMLAPFIGRVLDRLPARPIMIASSVLIGASLVGLSVSKSPWLSAVIIGLPLTIGYVGAGSMTMSVLIARWFVAQRGRAMALSSMGTSFATIAIPPVVGLLVNLYDWRVALGLIGLVVTALLVALAFLIRERPGPCDVEGGRIATVSIAAHSGSLGPESPASVRELLCMPLFWTLGLGVAVMLGVLQALSISIVPLAVERGVTALQATSLISLFGAGAFCGISALATVADKVDRLLLLTGLSCVLVILNGLLFVSEGYLSLATWAFLVGVASGPVAPVFFALLADCFGAASFGTVRGLMTPVMAVVGMAAIRFAGEIFDRTGGYELMIFAFAGALVGSVALFTWSRAIEMHSTGKPLSVRP